jgi:hypothetical protein
MTDFELRHGLDLLADEAQPATVDVYDIMARANARTRNRRATTATSLAIVTVAGGMVATIGLAGSTSGPIGGAPTSRTSTTSTSSSSAPKPIFDERSRHLTQVLAEAWPTIAPAGVTVEDSSVPAAVSNLSALEFGGRPLTPEHLLYEAQAKLSDAQGSTELSIEVWPPGEQVMEFVPNTPDQNRGYRQLDDGTQANLWTDTDPSATATATVEATILRPDGTTIWVRENNTDQTIQQGLTRPTTFFTAEGLIPFGMLFTY